MKKVLYSFLALILVLPLAIFATACGEVRDFVVITNGVETNYQTFNEAVSASQDGDTIVLYKDVTLNSKLALSKSLTLDGQGKYTLTSADDFSDAAMVYMTVDNVVVTLKNITLNANSKSRVAYVGKGKLVVDGATITGGKVTDNYVAGVFVTNKASFEMKGGKISGNIVEGTYADEYYSEYSVDLWIGANATGIISGGEVEYTFANANEYSASDKGSLTVNGGKISNLYVEYGKGYGADLHFVSGEITNLYVSKTSSNGEYYSLTAQSGNSYTGGSESPVNVEPIA